MKILAIETTGPHCSVALTDENGKISELSSDGTLNHLTNLTPMIGKLLENNSSQIGDITAIAASVGPGSFTGIRIGVTTARALCQAMDIPALAVPTLKSFAYHDEGSKNIICPVFDARRNQVYAGAYMWKNGKIEEVVAGNAYMLDEFLELLCKANSFAASAEFFGDGCEKYGVKIKEYLSDKGIGCEISERTQEAGSVAKLALDIYKEGRLLKYGELHPDYMRKAEAERKLEEKKACGASK